MGKEKTRNFQDIAGVSIITDRYGRQWMIKAMPISKIHIFMNSYKFILHNDSNVMRSLFLAMNLKSIQPGLWVRFRRLLGLSDFSNRYIAKVFSPLDYKRFRDEIFKVNLDMTYSEWIEDIKKKIEKKNQETGEVS